MGGAGQPCERRVDPGPDNRPVSWSPPSGSAGGQRQRAAGNGAGATKPAAGVSDVKHGRRVHSKKNFF